MVHGEIRKENYLFFPRRVVFFLEAAAFLLFLAIGFEKVFAIIMNCLLNSTTFQETITIQKQFLFYFFIPKKQCQCGKVFLMQQIEFLLPTQFQISF